MTAAELNRDIKRLAKAIDKARKDPNIDSSEYIDTVARKEFIRLYGADREMEYINKTSVLLLHRMNLSHVFIPLHSFGIYVKIEKLID